MSLVRFLATKARAIRPMFTSAKPLGTTISILRRHQSALSSTKAILMQTNVSLIQSKLTQNSILTWPIEVEAKDRDETHKRFNATKFSQLDRIAAAKWWAQFLPGRRCVSYAEINHNTRLENDGFMKVMHVMLEDKKRSLAISDETYSAFIEILADKLLTIERSGSKDLMYLQIGHTSCYEPPHIVIEAMREAGIYFPGFGLFPFKTEMRLYNNGHILVNGTVIHTNSTIVHYGPETSFERAPFMKVEGGKFRLIEIPGNLAENLVQTIDPMQTSDPIPQKLELWRISSPKEKDIPISIYAKICMSNFSGSETDFLKLSNEDWIAILRDPEQFEKAFKKHTYINFSREKSRIVEGNHQYGEIGKVMVEEIGENYYQYSTGIVRVQSVKQEGTIGQYSLDKVSPGDFIIHRAKDEALSFLSTGTSFIARQCDEKGNYISDIEYIPGEKTKLPVLDTSLDRLVEPEKNLGRNCRM